MSRLVICDFLSNYFDIPPLIGLLRFHSQLLVVLPHTPDWEGQQQHPLVHKSISEYLALCREGSFRRADEAPQRGPSGSQEGQSTCPMEALHCRTALTGCHMVLFPSTPAFASIPLMLTKHPAGSLQTLWSISRSRRPCKDGDVRRREVPQRL